MWLGAVYRTRPMLFMTLRLERYMFSNDNALRNLQ